jgi:sulfonate transport system permease protein
MTMDRTQGQTSPKWRAARRGATLPLFLLFVWWGAYGFGWTHSTLFVPPQQVVKTSWTMLRSGELPTAIIASIGRDLAGMLIGSVAGMIFALALGLSARATQIVSPTFHAIKQVSLFAWIPLLTVWFGLGELSKVMFISLAAFFPVSLNTLEGIAGIPRQYVEVARVFAFTPAQTFLRVVLPAVVPSLFNGLYLALVSSWIATLGAEYMMTSGSGVGNLLTDGRENFRMDEVILGVAVVGAVGFGLHAIAARIEAYLQRWRGDSAAKF